MFGFLKKLLPGSRQSRWIASAYMFNNRIFLHPVNMSAEGFGLAARPVSNLSDRPKAAELGGMVREALGLSETGAAMPDNPQKFFKPLLDDIGVKSWGRLHREALYVVAEMESGAITLTPHRTGGMVGMTRGFNMLNDRARKLPESCSDLELGSAVLAAFSDCEPYDFARDDPEDMPEGIPPTITIH